MLVSLCSLFLILIIISDLTTLPRDTIAWQSCYTPWESGRIYEFDEINRNLLTTEIRESRSLSPLTDDEDDYHLTPPCSFACEDNIHCLRTKYRRNAKENVAIPYLRDKIARLAWTEKQRDNVLKFEKVAKDLDNLQQLVSTVRPRQL